MTTHFIRLSSLCLLSISFLFEPTTANALENKPTHCAPIVSTKKQTPQNTISASDSAIYLYADKLLSKQSNLFDIEGNVNIQTNKQSIRADSAQYNRQQNRLTAQGNITYQENNLVIESDHLALDLKTNAGNAINTHYQLPNQNTNGLAEIISFENNEVVLSESTYSTCEGDNKIWQIRAKSIELHPEKNEGIARNMRLEIKNIPVLYLPYISFPIQGRKSGFLSPQPSYSSNAGYDIALPYYFNLKPNYDLTFVPRMIKTRGTQAGLDFRYLQKKSSGNIGIELLPNDKLTGRNRTYLALKQYREIRDDTKIRLEFAQVSDKQYFSDLGTELNTKNTAQLSREFRSETQGQQWLFNTVIQDYQMLDNNAEPYRRLPQLSLDMLNNFGNLKWRLTTQYSYYQRNAKDAIHRAIFFPKISLPMTRSFGYFTPALGINSRLYQRSDTNQTTRFVNWQFTNKAGLFFERNGNDSYQTLTPEIEYTYIPYKKQSQLPLIDSSLLNYDIDNLFTTNRYSGYDRIGDENRLSWSLSTDYSRSGRPLFSAQLTQAIYLSPHKSLLNGEKAIKKRDVVNAAMAKGQISSLISANVQAYHFSGESRLNNGNVSLNYKNSQVKSEQVEIAYRYRDQLVEQVSIIGIVDVSHQWRVAGRWLYSLNSQRTREALLGLEYNNCCWAIRLMARQYASRNNSDLNTSIGVQIELKGLTRIGSSLDKQFSDEVFGNQ